MAKVQSYVVRFPNGNMTRLRYSAATRSKWRVHPMSSFSPIVLDLLRQVSILILKLVSLILKSVDLFLELYALLMRLCNYSLVGLYRCGCLGAEGVVFLTQGMFLPSFACMNLLESTSCS